MSKKKIYYAESNKTNYSHSDACELFDYHEDTGLLDTNLSEEDFDKMMKFYDIGRMEIDVDPAGGSGLHSHI